LVLTGGYCYHVFLFCNLFHKWHTHIHTFDIPCQFCADTLPTDPHCCRPLHTCISTPTHEYAYIIHIQCTRAEWDNDYLCTLWVMFQFKTLNCTYWQTILLCRQNYREQRVYNSFILVIDMLFGFVLAVSCVKLCCVSGWWLECGWRGCYINSCYWQWPCISVQTSRCLACLYVYTILMIVW